ncbi:MAG: leucine-rich repeat protein [Bacteroidales bacterium]|nr:leucine-rich repeat protein [Bacteroidales bacterium]
MRRILLIISIILCSNLVLAQNTFVVGDITYKPTTGNEVKVRDCNSSATSIVIPETVTNNGITYNVTCVGEDAFSWCTSLVSIELPSTITTIESFAFYYCTALNSLVIPNAVTSLGWEICYNCSALTSVTIGSGISELSDGTFSYCDALQSITCLALEPPVLENSFVFPDVSTATLSVACGNLSAYSDTTNLWGQLFAGRISEIIYTVNATANDTAFGEVIVTSDCESAMLTATANPCYEFVSWNDGNTENPRYINLTSDTNLIANFTARDFGVTLLANICEGETYNENGFEINEEGTYTQTLQTENGCDSLITLILIVNPNFDTTIEATINTGETYSEFGFNETEAGIYTQTLQSEMGCDSTITLNLSVTASLLDMENTTLSFYPNPTKNEITFSTKIDAVEVIELSGKVVMKAENTNEINISTLSSGIYNIRLHSNGKTITQKLIKQ